MSLVKLLNFKRRLKPAPLPDEQSGPATIPDSADQSSEIYLAKPGGEREGPFSLDKLNLELAAGKYRSRDYWAWHKGLGEWVPLYEIRGISRTSTPAVTNAIAAPASPNLPTSAPAVATDPKTVSLSTSPDAAIPGSASLLGSPDISTVNPSTPTEPPKGPSASDHEPPREIPEDAPKLCASAQPTVLTAEERPEPTPSAPFVDLEPIAAVPEDRLLLESAETAEKEPENTPPVFQMLAEPQAELPDETIEGALLSGDTPVENPQVEDSVHPLVEPAEPSSAGETPPLAVPDANDPVVSADTPQAILARLKKSFLQTPEPSNEVTSYFNAGRTSRPEGFEGSGQTSGNEFAPRDGAQPVEPQSGAPAEASGPGSSPEDEYDLEAVLLAQQYSSGMPFAALEHIFLFTTGDGQSVWSSPIVKRMLEAVIGEKLDRIRQSTPRDVIFNCDLSQLLKRNGTISDAVWNAMAIREPSVVARARQKLSCTCVRTFHLETGTVVALVLYYNNQKLNPSAASPEPDSRAGRFTWSASAASPGFPFSR